MTAFLKIDSCLRCRRPLPWEWVPAVVLQGKPLSGTGVWRSQLLDGICPLCIALLQVQRAEETRAVTRRRALIRLLGGEEPYREFVFERYCVVAENRAAYERCKAFSPAIENLYLWGPCGVGKTHLAYAVGRTCFEETLVVMVVPAYQLSRRVRMKEPEQEHSAISELATAEVLILDDLGTGSDTAFTKQILQEILDRRNFTERAGLVVTSKYSLDELAGKMGDDSIPSRLFGMCKIIKVNGADHRLNHRPV